MLTTPSTAPSTVNGRVMSCSRNSKRMTGQVIDVAARAREEIIECDEGVTFRQQAVGQVRPDEAGSAGYDDTQRSSKSLILQGRPRVRRLKPHRSETLN